MIDNQVIIERLDALEKNLESEGRYVRANTAWHAAMRLKMISAEIHRLTYEWEGEAAEHSMAAEDCREVTDLHFEAQETGESIMHKLHAEVLRECAVAIRSIL